MARPAELERARLLVDCPPAEAAALAADRGARGAARSAGYVDECAEAMDVASSAGKPGYTEIEPAVGLGERITELASRDRRAIVGRRSGNLRCLQLLVRRTQPLGKRIGSIPEPRRQLGHGRRALVAARGADGHAGGDGPCPDLGPGLHDPSLGDPGRLPALEDSGEQVRGERVVHEPGSLAARR